MRVSVAMITYNHEAYIAQAIESVLMQATTFDYELIIGEDCSTDGTRAIVAAYARQYPTKIRALLPATNLGGLGKYNFTATTNACRGQYIAVLEGDDYWTAPDKLQKQVDFLETHPDFALCFHNVLKRDDLGRYPPIAYCTLQQQEVTADELLIRNVIPTCSVMYRRKLVTAMPDWYYALPMGDWPLWLLLAQQGKLGYLPDMMGVYRVHGGGLWSGESAVDKVLALITASATLGAQFGYAPATILARGLPIWLPKLSRGLAKELDPACLPEIDQALTALMVQWPATFPLSPQQTHQLWSKLYMSLAFSFHKASARRTVRYCLRQAVRYDPTWLGQRRFWSLLKRTLMAGASAYPPTTSAALPGDELESEP